MWTKIVHSIGIGQCWNTDQCLTTTPFGWQTSVVAAAIFGLSDAAKILLPMAAAALGGWNIRRRMAWFVAVIISVAAALSSLLQSDAQQLHASRTAADRANAARIDEARTRQQLAAITEASSVEALRQLADDTGAEAAREEASGGCGDRCRAHKARRNDYLGRLGLAERREALQRQLAASSSKAQANLNHALGAADALAALTGDDKFSIATIISLALSIATLIILELLASLSGDAALLLRRSAGTPMKQGAPTQNSATPITKPLKVVANRAYYLARLERGYPLLAARVHKGELSVHRACVEAGLRSAVAKRASRSSA